VLLTVFSWPIEMVIKHNIKLCDPSTSIAVEESCVTENDCYWLLLLRLTSGSNDQKIVLK
jgi:hypothetical protein